MFALFQNLELPSADHFKLHTFEFNDFELTDDETILASIRMMLELDFLNAVHAKREVIDYTLTWRDAIKWLRTECTFWILKGLK